MRHPTTGTDRRHEATSRRRRAGSAIRAAGLALALAAGVTVPATHLSGDTGAKGFRHHGTKEPQAIQWCWTFVRCAGPCPGGFYCC